MTVDVFAIVIIETLLKKTSDKVMQRRIIEDFCAPADSPSPNPSPPQFSAEIFLAFMARDDERAGRVSADAYGGGAEISSSLGGSAGKSRAFATPALAKGEMREFASYKKYFSFFHYTMADRVKRHVGSEGEGARDAPITERLLRDFITSTIEMAVMEIMSHFSLSEAKITRIVAASVRATTTVQKRLSALQTRLRRLLAKYSGGARVSCPPLLPDPDQLQDDTNISDLSCNGDSTLNVTGSTYRAPVDVIPRNAAWGGSQFHEINQTLLYLKDKGINLSELSTSNIAAGAMDETQKFFLEVSFVALKNFFSVTQVRNEVSSASKAAQKLGAVKQIVASHNNYSIDAQANNASDAPISTGDGDGDLLNMLNNELVLANEKIHLLSVRNDVLSLLHGTGVQFYDIDANEDAESKERARIAWLQEGGGEEEGLDPGYYKSLMDPTYYKQVVFSKADIGLILRSAVGADALAAVNAAEGNPLPCTDEHTASPTADLDAEDVSKIIVNNVDVSYESLHEELRELQLAVSTVGCTSQFLGLSLDTPVHILTKTPVDPQALLGELESAVGKNSSLNRNVSSAHSATIKLKARNKELERLIAELKTSAEQQLQERVEGVANSIELQCLRMEIQRCYAEIEQATKYKKEAAEFKNSCRELQATADSLRDQLAHHHHTLLSSPAQSDTDSVHGKGEGAAARGSKGRVLFATKTAPGSPDSSKFSEDAEVRMAVMQKDVNRLQNLVKSTEQRMKDSLGEQMSLNQQLHLTQDELIQSQTFISQLLKDLDFERQRWSTGGAAKDAKYVADLEDELSSVKMRLAQAGNETYKNELLLAELVNAEESVSTLDNKLSELQIEAERGQVALEQLDNYREQVRLKIQENRQLSLQLHSLQSTAKVHEGREALVGSLETQLKEAKTRVEKIPGVLAEIARLRGTSRAAAKSLNEQDAFLSQFKVRIARLEGENGRLKNDIRNFIDSDSKLKEANNAIDVLMKQLSDLKLQVASGTTNQPAASGAAVLKTKFKAAAHAIVEVIEEKAQHRLNHGEGESEPSRSGEHAAVGESAAKVQSVIQSVAAKPNVRRVSMTLHRLSTAADASPVDPAHLASPQRETPQAPSGTSLDLSTPRKRASLVQTVSAGLTNSGAGQGLHAGTKAAASAAAGEAGERASEAIVAEAAAAPAGVPAEVYQSQMHVARLAFESVKAIRDKYKG